MCFSLYVERVSIIQYKQRSSITRNAEKVLICQLIMPKYVP